MTRQKKGPEKHSEIDDYDYLANAASAMDFTGLIPSLPRSKGELESYNDICQFLPPKADKEDL